MRRFLNIQDMTLIAIFAAVITACSFIQIPFGPIPFTLQTFGVCITAGLLGAKRGTLSVIVYLILGLIGLPVFRGLGGVAVFTGPTGGFLIGFIFTAIIIGLVSDTTRNIKNRGIIIFVAMLIGIVVCLVIGCVQYMIITNVNLKEAILCCVVPFIVTDFVKVVLATMVVNRVRTLK